MYTYYDVRCNIIIIIIIVIIIIFLTRRQSVLKKGIPVVVETGSCVLEMKSKRYIISELIIFSIKLIRNIFLRRSSDFTAVTHIHQAVNVFIISGSILN